MIPLQPSQVTEIAISAHNAIQQQSEIYGRMLALLVAENQALRAELAFANAQKAAAAPETPKR